MNDFDEQLRAVMERAAGDAPGTAGLADGARRRLKVRRRRTAVLGAAAAVVAVVVPTAVIASGGDGQRPQPVGPTPGPEWYQEIEVTCVDGWSWPVAAMADGSGGEVDEGEVRAAFANLLQEAPMDAPEAIREHGFEDVPYVVLAGDDEEAVVGVGEWSVDGPGAGGDYVQLQRKDADLHVTSWGDCRDLSVALPEGRAQVEVSAPKGGVDPAATEVTVLVNERQCSSARDPRPHLDEPVISEHDDRVLVTMSSQAIVGGAHCMGTAPVPVTLHLDEPLGDRELYDAGTWPPTPIKVADEQVIVQRGVTVGRVPADWREFTCVWDDEDGGTFQVYGPEEEDACAYRTALAFYGAATFDPAHGPGEVVRDEGEGFTTWGGFVYSADQRTAVWVVTPERALTEAILESVDAPGSSHRDKAASLPCDPGMGEPRPREGCPDPNPDIGWLLMDRAGVTWFDPGRSGTDGERIRVELPAVSTCSGVITVGYRVPLDDHLVDCGAFRDVLDESPGLKIPVAVWSGSGVPILQLSELYRP